MYVCAFAGFAAMRAEVAAVDAGPRAMTRYAMSILAVEAGGAGVAALLPTSGHGFLLTLIVIVYGVSLLPTVVCARKARVTTTAPADRRRAVAARHARRRRRSSGCSRTARRC